MIRPSLFRARLLVLAAASIDVGLRFVIWALQDFRPHVPLLMWLVGVVPWLLLWVFALRDPAGAAELLLLIRAVSWIPLVLVVPIKPVTSSLVVSSLVVGLLLAARLLAQEPTRKSISWP